MDKSKEKEEQSIIDKSMRSVFVGNIPYEATEEKLKDIFSEVGPVLSFKLVFDRETGKPKGYGFCEYKDQETALSAMRNLNGYEIGGRSLRVDNACTEKSRMEMQALMQGPLVENPYGAPVEPERAPEAVSAAVASLPPEQMFELMKQMKLCIQNDPAEARNMLLHNPQLAYALLQAQVIMRIVDPATAASMLHPSHGVPPPLQPAPRNAAPPAMPTAHLMPGSLPPGAMPPSMAPGGMGPAAMGPSGMGPGGMGPGSMGPSSLGPGDVDLRGARDQDMRSLHHDPVFARDPRLGGARHKAAPAPPPSAPPSAPAAPAPPPAAPAPPPPRHIPGIPHGASDQEKAALIMQVLQLSEEQIALLPPEQRASILMLKDQIAKSTQR